MYYWINTSLEYQATNEHFDCIVVSQNICIRETVKNTFLMINSWLSDML